MMHGSKNIEIERQADEFLRKHDSLYGARNKNSLMSYPYLSERQIGIRNSKEIPISNLNAKQKKKCWQLGDSLHYDEC